MSLLPGDLAPDFTLDSVLDGMVEKVVIILVHIFIINTIILVIIAIVQPSSQVTLSSFRGQYVALMFYPVDFGEENHEENIDADDEYDDDDEDHPRLRDPHRVLLPGAPPPLHHLPPLLPPRRLHRAHGQPAQGPLRHKVFNLI